MCRPLSVSETDTFRVSERLGYALTDTATLKTLK